MSFTLREQGERAFIAGDPFDYAQWFFSGLSEFSDRHPDDHPEARDEWEAGWCTAAEQQRDWSEAQLEISSQHRNSR